MAVPSSGSLSMQDIACEKVFDNYNHPTDGIGASQRAAIGAISLADVSTSGNSNGSGTSFDATNTNSSSYPNGTTPHSMSEFYSYDHDATSSSSSATYYFSSSAGSSCFSTSGVTVYWSGSGDALDQGHRIYTNSGLTTLATAGYYRSEETDVVGYSRLWSQTAGGTWFGSPAYCGV
jgi:hypothetical protein